jgi:NADPH2:quinone reductase
MKAPKSPPAEMSAAVIENGKLVLSRRPVPKPGTGEVLVRVHAAGINRPDILQRRGLYPPPPGITDIPGLEISGTVVALGKSAGSIKKGAKICALVTGGGYAEYCVVPAPQCLPIPKGLDWAEAAALPETFFTVWRNVFNIGQLKKGESILVHGGASGIGTTAIQMAKSIGAKVFVTTGSEKKNASCKKLGAHVAINYKQQDFVTEIMKETKDQGVDMILDMVGGDYIPRNLKALKTGGRHVSIAAQHGRKVEVDISLVMIKQLSLTGSTLRAQPVAVKGAIAKELKKKIWPLIARKKIMPVIDRTYPLAESQAAHDYLDSGAHIGKVVLIL